MTLAALSGLLPLCAPPARAQFEIDADHFESPNVEPFDKVKTHASSDVGKISYDGKFRLAYAVECNRKSLLPGRYSVSLRCDRKVASATLNQDAKPSELEAFYTDRRPARETTWNAKEQHGGCQQSN